MILQEAIKHMRLGGIVFIRIGSKNHFHKIVDDGQLEWVYKAFDINFDPAFRTPIDYAFHFDDIMRIDWGIRICTNDIWEQA